MCARARLRTGSNPRRTSLSVHSPQPKLFLRATRHVSQTPFTLQGLQGRLLSSLATVPPSPSRGLSLSRIPTLRPYLSRTVSLSLRDTFLLAPPWQTQLASPRTRRAPPPAPPRSAPFPAGANLCVLVFLSVVTRLTAHRYSTLPGVAVWVTSAGRPRKTSPAHPARPPPPPTAAKTAP